jgi:serine/threonine-protein kinase RsbW
MRSELRNWLTDVGASNGEKEDIVLACWEAAANAIEHPLHADGHVHVVVERCEEQIFVCVADSGEWREQLEDRPERGLGLKLIGALMDRVQVVRTSDGTRVLMCRGLAPR